MASGNDWDRDHILANFQALSGNEDITKCIEILESFRWDIQLALNSVFGEEQIQTIDRPIHVDDSSSYMQIDNIPTGQVESVKKLNFKVSWHGQLLSVLLDETNTVEDLKQGLSFQLGIPICEINLQGWPSGDPQNKTILSSLNLSDVVQLIIQAPSKVTVTSAKYMTCNIPQGDEDEEVKLINVSDAGHSSQNSLDDIMLNINHGGRDHKLSFKSNQTVKEVKSAVSQLTKLSTRNQDWHGWPNHTSDNSRLNDLALSEDHILLVNSLGDEPSTSHNEASSSKPREATESVGDAEDVMFHDEYDDTIFDSAIPTTRKLKTLLSRDSSDDADIMVQFQQNFEERYGEIHPHFYLGPLKNAIDEATGSRVEERRPLLVYLHHDNSILSNIFCSQILCSQQLVSFVTQNFVIWPWDVTEDSNRQRFVNLLVTHFGNSAAGTISKYRDSDYPLLMIVMKSKAGLEVCSVLQANASLDEVMMSLIQGFEVFEQTKLVEIKAESERMERDLMKQEQDAAYYESLAADRAKAQAEQIKQDEEIEKSRQAQMDQDLKEAERVSCAEQLSEEPPASTANTTNIRFRFPDGDRIERRFHENEKLNVIFLYVTSKGYNTSEHRIVTNFPRTQLSKDSLQRTLKELKLSPQANLFVEEI